MHKIVFSLFATLLLASCASLPRTIQVNNNTNTERKGEMVEVKASSLRACFHSKSYVLKNDKNEEVPYQLIYNGKKKAQAFIFQANVSATSTGTYTLSVGTPAIVKAKTFARHVPERKDDFAWENDGAAYRMYGPALANENPSNGADLWLKRTDELIVDKFYHDELQNGISYHVDNGLGLDCYAVGHTMGAGGIAPYSTDSLWIGNHYDTYRVSENGPLRSVFTLTYDSVKVDNDFLKQEITITVNAGSMLNKAVVKYTGVKKNMELATGIFLHDGKGQLKLNATNGTAAYAEDALSNAKVPSGRNYVGVFVPAKVNAARKQGVHALLLSDYRVGDSFTYYFGGGWSKWGYPADEDWFNAMNRFSENVRIPLQVSLK